MNETREWLKDIGWLPETPDDTDPVRPPCPIAAALFAAEREKQARFVADFSAHRAEMRARERRFWLSPEGTAYVRSLMVTPQ